MPPFDTVTFLNQIIFIGIFFSIMSIIYNHISKLKLLILSICEVFLALKKQLKIIVVGVITTAFTSTPANMEKLDMEKAQVTPEVPSTLPELEVVSNPMLAYSLITLLVAVLYYASVLARPPLPTRPPRSV